MKMDNYDERDDGLIDALDRAILGTAYAGLVVVGAIATVCVLGFILLWMAS